MKKKIISTLLVCGLTTGLQAGGDIGGAVSFENSDLIDANNESSVQVVESKKIVEEVNKEVKEEIKVVEAPKKAKNFYMVAKGIYTMGDEVDNLDADSGYGAGIDFGYRLGGGFASELGFAFSKSALNNPAENEISSKTAGLSLVYTYDVAKAIGVFAKVGYMYEQQKIDSLNIDDDDSGVSYGAGVEYKINDDYGVVAEYQGSTIDSLRGDTASLGLMYNF